MTLRSDHSRELLNAILQETERADRAARIEFDSELDSALDARGRLIAKLFGLSEQLPLPAYDPSHVRAEVKGLGKRYPSLWNDLASADRKLSQSLEVRQHRLTRSRIDIGDGNRVLKQLRSFSPAESGSRFDRQG